MTFSNFAFRIVPGTLKFSKPRVRELKADGAVINSYLLKNGTEAPMKVRLEMDYTLSSEISHSTSYKFAEGLKFSEKTKISAGLEGVADGTYAFKQVVEFSDWLQPVATLGSLYTKGCLSTCWILQGCLLACSILQGYVFACWVLTRD